VMLLILFEFTRLHLADAQRECREMLNFATMIRSRVERSKSAIKLVVLVATRGLRFA
jgi:hypothetical protein